MRPTIGRRLLLRDHHAQTGRLVGRDEELAALVGELHALRLRPRRRAPRRRSSRSRPRRGPRPTDRGTSRTGPTPRARAARTRWCRRGRRGASRASARTSSSFTSFASKTSMKVCAAAARSVTAIWTRSTCSSMVVAPRLLWCAILAPAARPSATAQRVRRRTMDRNARRIERSPPCHATCLRPRHRKIERRTPEGSRRSSACC